MLSLERVIHRMHIHPDGFAALSYNYFLSNFAVGMIGIFGAVFIYQLSSVWYWGVLSLAAFYVGQRLVTMMLLPLMVHLLERWGYRRVMSLSLLALVARVVFFMQTAVSHWVWLIPAAVLGGVYLAGYFLAFHGLFLDDHDDTRLGEQAGWLALLKRMALVVSPFVAGLLVEQVGFAGMFGVAGLILLVSLVPLFGMPHHMHSTRGYSLKRVFTVIGKHRHFALAVYGWSLVQGILSVYWPVYLLSVVGQYSLLGAFSSVAMLFSSITVFEVGKTYDKRALKRGFPIASLVVGVTWVLRFMAQLPSTVLVADTLGRVFSPLWWMKIRRFELAFGERINTLVFSVAHELLWSLGIVSAVVLGGGVILVSGGTWAWMLVPAMGAVFVSAWAAKDK